MFLAIFQNKEPDGDDSTVPKEITDNLDKLTAEQLKVKFKVVVQ